jgi:hypothetical protein
MSGLRRMVGDLIHEERIKLWDTPIEVDQILELVDRPRFPGVIAALYRCYAQAKRKPLWGDKNPDNLCHMDLLNRWFPNCRFLHIIRDGRDACLSQLEQSFGKDDLLLCASDWREQVQWVRRIGNFVGPARYSELRYEDLVRDPETELRQLCVFLGIPYDAEMLKYHERVSQSIPSSKLYIWPKIVKPPQSDNVNRWKDRMFRGLQVCLEKRAGSILRELGYEVSSAPWSGGYYQEIRSIVSRGWLSIRRKLKINRRVQSPDRTAWSEAWA